MDDIILPPVSRVSRVSTYIKRPAAGQNRWTPCGLPTSISISQRVAESRSTIERWIVREPTMNRTQHNTIMKPSTTTTNSFGLRKQQR